MTCQKPLQIPAVGSSNSLTLLLAGQDLNVQDKGADRMLMIAIDLDIEAEVPHIRSQKCSLGLLNLMVPCWRREFIVVSTTHATVCTTEIATEL